MTPRTFFVTLLQLGLAGTVLLLSHYHYAWVAAPLVLIPAGYAWVKSGRSSDSLLASAPGAIVGLSVVVLVGLSREPLGVPVFPPLTQVILTVLYAGWLMWMRQLRLKNEPSLAVLALQQVVATSAIFLAAAFWHWPESVIVALMWITGFVSAMWYLKLRGERGAAILAGTYALVVAEVSWIMYAWQVNYIIPAEKNILFIPAASIIIPQASLVILGVGYCFVSIYESHREKRLSRRRLIEYVMIAALLLTIVVFGTRWNGTA